MAFSEAVQRAAIEKANKTALLNLVLAMWWRSGINIWFGLGGRNTSGTFQENILN